MNGISKLTFLLLILSLLTANTAADDIVGMWSPRHVEGVGEKEIAAATRMSAEEIWKKNLSVGSWPEVFLMMVGANQNKGDRALLAALVSQLTDKTQTQLKKTGRLIIWERITSGDILFDGMGYQSSDDLFTVAGRANWMLRNMTKKNLGYVKPHTSAEELARLQQKWARWLKGEAVEEYRDEYVLSRKELRELKRGITGPETLEALITSLKPHESKAARREKCLEAQRSFSGMPTAPISPQGWAVCDPDMMAQGYLRAMTGIKDRHGYDWWKQWWQTNKNQLVWNKEKEIFEVKK